MEEIELIKQANEKDISVLAKMALKIWKNNTLAELEEEFSEIVGSEASKCYILYVEAAPAGFAHCQLRYDYVEGTKTSPVGYLEGIFIEEKFRHRGFARELLGECEKWAGERGCSEFASDCELDNEESLKFHIAMGFEEANRIICFKKEL